MTHQSALDFAARGMVAQNRSIVRRLGTLDRLARGIAENLPLGLPPVMGVAIAESRNSATQIASGVTYGFDSSTAANHMPHHFGLYGGTWEHLDANTLRCRTGHEGNGTLPTANPTYHSSATVRFATYADKFEVMARNYVGFRVRVNGKYCKAGMYGVSALNGDAANAQRFYLFDFTGTEFAGEGLKLVEILGFDDFRFRGARVPMGYTVQPWPTPQGLRAALHTDSMGPWVSDTGTDYRTSQHCFMPHIVQGLTGVPDIQLVAIPNAGFVFGAGSPTPTKSNFVQQTPVDLVGKRFDVVWNTGSRNDEPYFGSLNNYRDVVIGWLNLLFADNPDLIVFLTGPLQVSTGKSYQSNAAIAAIQNAKKAAAAAFPRNCAFIPVAGTAVTNDPWVFGTGKQGATTGDGNADRVCGNDGQHYTVHGHQYAGTRLVTETARVIPLLASRIRDGVIAGVNDLDLV